MKKLVIAIDFDGTIVENEYPEIGGLKPDAKKVINRLHSKGHTIIIWTCRCNQHPEYDDLSDMKWFLFDNEIKFDCVNQNDKNIVQFGCFPKIYANVFIDDRNISGIPSWIEIEKIINEMAEGK